MSAKHLFACLLTAAAFTGGAACAPSLAQQQQESGFRARKQLTRELLNRGEWGGAFAYADELNRQRPGDPEVLTMRGIVYRERNLPAEAEADLRAALASDERQAEAHGALAIVLDSSGRSEEADRHHRRAVELEPQKATHLNNLGFSLLVRRKQRDAVEVIERAARLDPTNRRIRTNLGFAYAATGDLVRAAREFDMGGTAAESRNNLGFAYEHRGDLRNAFDLYAEAVRLDPASRRARSNLGHVAGRLGRPLPADWIEPPAGSSLPVNLQQNTKEPRP